MEGLPGRDRAGVNGLCDGDMQVNGSEVVAVNLNMGEVMA